MPNGASGDRPRRLPVTINRVPLPVRKTGCRRWVDFSVGVAPTDKREVILVDVLGRPYLLMNHLVPLLAPYTAFQAEPPYRRSEELRSSEWEHCVCGFSLIPSGYDVGSESETDLGYQASSLSKFWEHLSRPPQVYAFVPLSVNVVCLVNTANGHLHLRGDVTYERFLTSWLNISIDRSRY